MSFLDSWGTVVDFSSKINLQGPILTFSESWGTEFAISANFARFSSVFNPFVPETHKNTIHGYLQYNWAHLGVFSCFYSLNGYKMMSIYILINPQG